RGLRRARPPGVGGARGRRLHDGRHGGRGGGGARHRRRGQGRGRHLRTGGSAGLICIGHRRGGQMELQIKGRNLEVSESMRTFAERKLAKLDRLVHQSTRVEVELSVEKNPSVAANQIAEATVWLKGRTLRAKQASRDMKASIDALTEKLHRELAEL